MKPKGFAKTFYLQKGNIAWQSYEDMQPILWLWPGPKRRQIRWVDAWFNTFTHFTSKSVQSLRPWKLHTERQQKVRFCADQVWIKAALPQLRTDLLQKKLQALQPRGNRQSFHQYSFCLDSPSWGSHFTFIFLWNFSNFGQATRNDRNTIASSGQTKQIANCYRPHCLQSFRKVTGALVKIFGQHEFLLPKAVLFYSLDFLSDLMFWLVRPRVNHTANWLFSMHSQAWCAHSLQPNWLANGFHPVLVKDKSF